MPFDPRQVGFTWSEETTLTNPTGEALVIRPFGADFADLRKANGKRIEECYRYYTGDGRILTELEVKKWLAGGDSVCSSLCSVFRDLFDAQPGKRLTLNEVLAALQERDFTDIAIGINLRWLLQDGYVVATNESGVWWLEAVKV
jgi:hypothetical protein